MKICEQCGVVFIKSKLPVLPESLTDSRMCSLGCLKLAGLKDLFKHQVNMVRNADIPEETEAWLLKLSSHLYRDARYGVGEINNIEFNILQAIRDEKEIFGDKVEIKMKRLAEELGELSDELDRN